jgi:hypothetical protein
VALPFDLIPDHYQFGLLDDALAVVAAVVGIGMMVKAHEASPMPPWALTAVNGLATYNQVNLYNATAVFTMIILVFSKTIRYSLVAVNAICGIPCLCFSNCAFLWALGFTGVGWGVVFSMIPHGPGSFAPASSLLIGVAAIVLAGYAGIPLLDTRVGTDATMKLLMTKVR